MSGKESGEMIIELNSGCCSFGQCTHEIVCEGNKNILDNCDISSECFGDLVCQSGFCHNATASKSSSESKNKDQWTIVILVSFLVLIISQLISVCLSKLSSDDDRTVNRNLINSNRERLYYGRDFGGQNSSLLFKYQNKKK